MALDEPAMCKQSCFKIQAATRVPLTAPLDLNPAVVDVSFKGKTLELKSILGYSQSGTLPVWIFIDDS